MGNVIGRLILATEIKPALNNSFWEIVGTRLLNILAFLRDALANLAYVICKFALNVIDFMQLLVQKLAGVDVWLHLDRLDLNNLKETDIVFRFLLSDTVTTVFRSMLAIFVVLLLVFSIIAILKNEYGAAASGKAVDHKQTWYAAFRAILTVVMVPMLLIGGIITSNAILAGLMKAFNVNSALSLGGQIYMASAYSANDYRLYAQRGVRVPVSNAVGFTYGGSKVYVDSQANVIMPGNYDDGSGFCGYEFLYDGNFFLWECEESNKGAVKAYLENVLNAQVVKAGASDSRVSKEYEALAGIVNSDGYINGFNLNDLNSSDGRDKGRNILQAAYNTWQYNKMLTNGNDGWAEKDETLEFESNNIFVTKGGGQRKATTVSNSSNWAKYHDGGRDGFHPLAVEYEVMADVIDFAIGNNVKLYFVNSNNNMISTNVDGIDINTLYNAGTESYNKTGGYLVEYKNHGRVAYARSADNMHSEIEGATYIVCYYSAEKGVYIPLVNDAKIYDDYGNSYTFKSSKYADSYHGVVIARGLFKKVNSWIGYAPTYIAQTMVATNEGISVFDDTQLVSAHLQTNNYYYTFLEKQSDATMPEYGYFAADAYNGAATYDSSNFVYFSTSDEDTITPSALAQAIVNKFAGFVGAYELDLLAGSTFTPGDGFVGQFTYGTSEQIYTMRFEFVEKITLLASGGGNIYAYKFATSLPSAYGYTSDLSFANSNKTTVVGHDGYYVSYSNASDIHELIYWGNQETGTYSTREQEIFDAAVLQMIKNTSYRLEDMNSQTSADGLKIEYTVYESSVGDSYQTGAKKWKITLQEQGSAIVDGGKYKRTFVVNVETEELHIADFAKFNEIVDLSDYSAATIGSPSDTEPGSNIRFYGDNLYYTSDNSHFSAFDYAYNTTVKISKYLQSHIVGVDGYTPSVVADSIKISRAGANEYVASFEIMLTKGEMTYKLKVALSLASKTDTGYNLTPADDLTRIYVRKIAVNTEIQNSFKLHSAATINTTGYSDEIKVVNQDLYFSDFVEAGTDRYVVDGTTYTAHQYYIYDYNDLQNPRKFIFNAYYTTGSNAKVDGGLVFAGYSKTAGGVGINSIIGDNAKEVQLFYKLSKVRVALHADYIKTIDDGAGNLTYYVVDLLSASEDVTFVYTFTLNSGATMDNIVAENITIKTYKYNSANSQFEEIHDGPEQTREAALSYVRTHVNISYEYLPTKKFLYYEEKGDTGTSKLYSSANIESIGGKNYIFMATNVADSDLPSGAITPENRERLFYQNLTTLVCGSEEYIQSNTTDDAVKILEKFARNPLAIIFCCDEIKERLLVFDFRFGLTWDGILHPQFHWRLHVGPQFVKDHASVVVGSTSKLEHKQAVQIRSGMLAIDYNFAGSVAVDNIYATYAINWLVLIIAIVIVFSILGKAVWGLIKRIYQITLLYLVMPAVASTIPFDNNKRFGQWREEIIKEVLGTYGVCLGLNFFFIIMPVIRDASAIFTDADINVKSMGLLSSIVNADMLNLLVYLLFLLVALTLLKTVPTFINGIVGGKDVIEEGAKTKKDVLSSVSEAGKIVSGKAAVDAANNAANMMFGEKDKKTGKRGGGLLTPGKAIGVDLAKKGKGIYDAIRGKKENKKKDAEDKAEQERNEFNKNAQSEEASNLFDSVLNRGEQQPEQPKQEGYNVDYDKDATSVDAASQNYEAATGGVTAETDQPVESATAQNAENAYTADTAQNSETAQEAKEANEATGELEARVSGLESDVQNLAMAGKMANATASGKVLKDYYGEKLAADAKAEQEAKQQAEEDKANAKAAAKETRQAEREERRSARQEARAERDEERAAEKEQKARDKNAARDDKFNAKIKKLEEKAEQAGVKRSISKDDIERWNKQNKNRQIVDRETYRMMSIEEKRAQDEIRREARKEAYTHDRVLVLNDYKNGIKHGPLASLTRSIVGGEKTSKQKEREENAINNIHDKLREEVGEKWFNKTFGDGKHKQEFKALQNNPMLKQQKIDAYLKQQGFDDMSPDKKKQFVEDMSNDPKYREKTKALFDELDKAHKKADENKTGALYNVGKGASWLGKQAGRAITFVGGKTWALTKWTGTQAGRLGSWTGHQAARFGSWTGHQAARFGSWTGRNAKRFAHFASGVAVKTALATKDFTVKVAKAVANSAPVQGTIKAAKATGKGIATAAKATGKGIATAAKATGKGIATAAIATGKGVGKVSVATGKGIATAAKATGKGISTAAIATGKGIATAAKATGKGIATAAKATGKGISTAAIATGKVAVATGKGVGRFVVGTGGAIAGGFVKMGAHIGQFSKELAGEVNNRVVKPIRTKLNGMPSYLWVKDKIKENRYKIERRSADRAYKKSLKGQKAITQSQVEKEVEKLNRKVQHRNLDAKHKADEKRQTKKDNTITKSREKAENLRQKAADLKVKAESSKQAASVARAKSAEYASKIKNPELRRELEKARGDYNKALNRIRGEMDYQIKQRVDRAVQQAQASTQNKLDPKFYEKAVRKEVEKRLRELNDNATRNGVDAKTNAEIAKLKGQLARLNSVNSVYNRRIKSLGETNKRLARQVKNTGKGVSAVQSQLNRKSSFGENASGKS